MNLLAGHFGPFQTSLTRSVGRTFYAAAKKSAQREQLDCAVFGNTIPFPLGGALLKGACDIAHFEWSTVHGHWGLRPMGLPPKGRVGYVTRLGAALSDAPFCWPSIYVNKDRSGTGHENLHKSRGRRRRPLRVVGARLDERVQPHHGQVRGRILRLV